MKTAPGQEDLLDIPADGYEGLRIQAEKFTASELARVIDLLLAAQSDMRWTTSPRLSLELALVRATIPETDPSPAGTLSRLERLERLANLEPGSTVPSADTVAPAADAAPLGDPARSSVEPAETAPAASGTSRGAEVPSEPAPAAPAAIAEEPPPPAPRAGHRCAACGRARATSTSRCSAGRGRRSLDHLSQVGQPVLRALLESATPASFDGETLELAFPPSFRNNLRQVNTRVDHLQAALGDLFGIRPRIECVTRESHVGGTEPAAADVVDEVEEPSEEEALKRLKDVLGATPAERAGSRRGLTSCTRARSRS